ncbi:MAG: DNA polymerase III subunit delta' [Gammaproteobacteria bacterium]
MSDIYPWQQDHWAQLQVRVAARRLPHGLLFSGPAGLGKRAFAEAFAAALLCPQPQADGTACGRCTACRLRLAGTHPDLLRIRPPEDKTQIGIDQIRELSQSLSLKSHAGGYQIALLEPAERMTTAAANSLLKTLEEPTDHTILVLVTEQPARLPATVRSRCQTLRFPVPSPELAEGWLAERCGGDPQLVLRLADGAPLRALELAQSDTLTQRAVWIGQLLEVRRGRQDPTRVAADWFSDALLRPLYWAGQYLADAIRLRQGGEVSLKNSDMLNNLQALAESAAPAELHAALERAWQHMRLAQQAGVNRQLLLEEFLIDWGRGGQQQRRQAR